MLSDAMQTTTTPPTKPEIVTAMQSALTAALHTEEPWGNDYATGALGAQVWLAREAEDGSDALYRALDEARSVAHVALRCTPGMRTVEALEALFTRWWGYRVDIADTSCRCGSSMCEECAKAAKWAAATSRAMRAMAGA